MTGIMKLLHKVFENTHSQFRGKKFWKKKERKKKERKWETIKFISFNKKIKEYC